MTRRTVVRLGIWPEDAEWAVERERRGFEDAGHEYLFVDSLDPEAVAGRLRGADAIVAAGGRWDGAVFEQLERLELLHLCLVGLDEIDLDAASEHGVKVSHIPDVFTTDVAEHTLALVLACRRRVRVLDAAVRAGRWADAPIDPIERFGSTVLGLLGMGRIARAVAVAASGLGMRVLAHDALVERAPAGVEVRMVGFEELFAEADVVSCHVPLTPATRGLVGTDAFALMKPTAYLVNTSRGPVVDEAALIAALRDGRIAGAALDVLETEPPDPSNPLRTMDEVVLTPHIAGYSTQAIAQTADRAVADVLAFFDGGEPTRWAHAPDAQPGARESL